MSPRLLIDPDRAAPRDEDGSRMGPSTGIFVRAWNADGRCVNACISELDKASLLAWLKSRGGDNRWAEDVVGILLGHGHLHLEEGG